MHRLATIPGGWEAGSSPEGVVFIDQTPAPFIVMTAADTDIWVLSQARTQLSPNFPALRVVNLLQLQQQLTIDTYAETVLAQAQGILLRVLGGRAYWFYGLDVVRAIAAQFNIPLVVLPGDDRPDLELMSYSTVPLTQVESIWRYFVEGGVTNYCRALQWLPVLQGHATQMPLPAETVPKVGLYTPLSFGESHRLDPPRSCRQSVGILFYRAHYLAGNTAAIDQLWLALYQRQLWPVAVYAASLQEIDQQQAVLAHWQRETSGIAVLINTMSFSLAKMGGETLNLDLWRSLDVPVIQAICSGGTVERWQNQSLGLSPRDMAMNVVLPEVDGRIIGRAISFKAARQYDAALETELVGYEPLGDRIQFVAELAANWARLRQTPVTERRVALILANYPTRDGRLANGVGLDTPASCLEILHHLKQVGYSLSSIPASGTELIRQLTQGITNDPEGRELRRVEQSLVLTNYEQYFDTLPLAVQQAICERWGSPAQSAPTGAFAIAGLQFGHVFVGIQPARGYDLDPSLNYHAPDLVPTHAYLAFYCWLRQQFAVHAVVHVGKHGNLEWLPGKSIALSQGCFPEVALGPMPHLYPFIVNDPGEGSQAKRRAQAVIIDHLTPPLTRAELYGPLQDLEALIDEYYTAQTLDPSRLPVIRDRLLALITTTQIDQDLGLTLAGDRSLEQLAGFCNRADGYLCELKEAQIRDGLHILGQCPAGQQLQDLLIALARSPGPDRLGLTQAIASDWRLSFDPLTAELGDQLIAEDREVLAQNLGKVASGAGAYRTVGDAVAHLEAQASELAATLLADIPAPVTGRAVDATLTWMGDRLLSALRQTDQELVQLLRGLDGRYIPSGPSGAPTRGRPDVLPTGRNFYSVDIRGLPTESAWDVGRKAAETLIERYTQEQGDYPRTLALSLWGTATMRTGGDDVAEALALLGVRPLWDGASRRVIDFEILPVTALGRPRVDVTLRVSGFFRDAFSNLIDLFDRAVQAVAQLNEPPSQNPLAAQVQAETAQWQSQGVPPIEAQRRSRYRVFGSKPGAYGAGLQGLIESQNWSTDADLAQAYLAWSSYAYTAQSVEQWGSGVDPDAATGLFAPEAFAQRLGHTQIVLHNQDNREHDLLDSDDYYQFQGGLTAAVRAQGQNPVLYFGDHSQPANPKVRTLTEEIARVYRSRVINPKWIAGVMRHGYKGAFEMAATVDYLFAYDATTHCVPDHMYQGVADAYLFDLQVQDFVQQHNPWALREMAERLLEAQQRGLWPSAAPATLADLRSLVHQAEAVVEGLTDPHPRSLL